MSAFLVTIAELRYALAQCLFTYLFCIQIFRHCNDIPFRDHNRHTRFQLKMNDPIISKTILANKCQEVLCVSWRLPCRNKGHCLDEKLVKCSSSGRQSQHRPFKRISDLHESTKPSLPLSLVAATSLAHTAAALVSLQGAK